MGHLHYPMIWDRANKNNIKYIVSLKMPGVGTRFEHVLGTVGTSSLVGLALFANPKRVVLMSPLLLSPRVAPLSVSDKTSGILVSGLYSIHLFRVPSHSRGFLLSNPLVAQIVRILSKFRASLSDFRAIEVCFKLLALVRPCWLGCVNRRPWRGSL